MTPNQARRARATQVMPDADEAGVSTVLGAILMFALLVITLVTIQVKFVPVWDHDREADHMKGVSNSFAQMASDVGRQADNRTNIPLTDSVPIMAPQGFRFFSGATLPGQLAFAPPAPGGGFTVTSPQMHITSLGGRQIFAGSETWNNIITAGTLSNVESVQNLRLRILDVDATPVQYDGMSTQILVTDADDVISGAIRLTWLKGSSGFTFQFQTWVGDPDTPGNQPISLSQDAYDQQALPPSTCPVAGHAPPLSSSPSEVPCIYTDLLRSDLQFDQVLLLTEAPFSLTLSSTGLVADYAMAHTVANPGGGSTQVGGGGKLVTDYEQNLAGGSLELNSLNTRYPQQTYKLEHGAVLLTQPDGTAMVVPPQFSVAVVGGQTNVNWVVPALTGSATSLSGSTHASITFTPGGGRVNLVATAPELVFTLTTEHPATWAGYWSSALTTAGLTGNVAAADQPCVATDAQFKICTVTTGASTSATLKVYGLVVDPAQTSIEDIQFTFKGASIGTMVQVSGGT